ncbi:MAG: dihydroxyacetone kinase subunit DhaK, partial [Gammaproteobacteria bacterium]|nr:dihydroxyacetone kinase subunit DhaK [Gammaproteobacteria bacterium]
MKKILNAPERALDQSLSGLVAAHPDIVAAGASGRFITRKHPKAGGKVALISGGGSGHEPLH